MATIEELREQLRQAEQRHADATTPEERDVAENEMLKAGGRLDLALELDWRERLARPLTRKGA